MALILLLKDELYHYARILYMYLERYWNFMPVFQETRHKNREDTWLLANTMFLNN
jgi:hypothetical protein